MKLRGLSALFALYASVSFASQTPALKVDAKDAKGTVEFTAIGMPSALKIRGKGNAPTGAAQINHSQVTGEFDFDLNSLDTGIQMRNEHMKNKYLEVGRFPQAKLKITKMMLPKTLDADGASEKVPFEAMLTVHGVEKPVQGTASVERKGSQIEVQAQTETKVKDHGIASPSFAGITMAEEVKISVQFTAPITTNP